MEEKDFVDLAELDMKTPTYEEWLELGAKKTADDVLRNWDYTFFGYSFAHSNDYDRSGYIYEVEPADLAGYLESCSYMRPLEMICTGAKFATYQSGCGWNFETLENVVGRELENEFGHIIYRFNQDVLKKAGISEEDFVVDYIEDLNDWENRYDYLGNLVYSYKIDEALSLLGLTPEEDE